ncbi:hypothetical protein [Spirosoma linguale]|uniref:Glycosyltransferase RgtA/B/C/D-like domain-containing protein n=1 Tax=Spirosoma linguale (strain ATCC 33905 / DSM 74 / LMG 10896 / Claus 1) TaxID=504472 RepID=D2QKG5_SPILD|nr:hypothetical protein Slin_2979 [Spirosoma linguale DSM 74]
MSATITAPITSPLAPRLQKVASLLITLPIFCFVLFVWTYAVNVPWFDDIDAFLGFTLAFTNAADLSDKIYNIFVPNNEHRIVVAKLITLAMYYLTGEVNFRWLILIALLFMLGTLALFGRVFRSMRVSWLLFAPVPFLMLQPQYYLTSLWSIPGLQHPVVICLTLSSLYLLTRSGRSQFAGAVIMQVFATLSMSNGLMGWVAGGLVLALHKKWYKLAGWLAGSVLAVVLYFYNFQSASRTGESLAYSLAHPLQAIAAFFTFTGGLFDFIPAVKNVWRYAPPTVGGVVLAALVLGLLYRMNRNLWTVNAQRVDERLEKRRLFFSGAYVFFYGNAAIIALLRLRYGYDVMVVSNYMIYPAVLTALVYLNILSECVTWRAQQWCLRIGLAGGILIWLFTYGYYWPKMAFRKQMLLTSAMNQKHNDIGLGATWGTPFAEVARSIMRESVSRGIYHYPDSYITPVEPILMSMNSTVTTDSCLSMDLSGGEVIYKTATAANAYPTGLDQAAIVVKSDRRTILYASETPFTFRNFWLNKPVTSAHSEILTIVLAPGRYQVGVLTPSLPNQPVRFSCQSLTVPK